MRSLGVLLGFSGGTRTDEDTAALMSLQDHKEPHALQPSRLCPHTGLAADQYSSKPFQSFSTAAFFTSSLPGGGGRDTTRPALDGGQRMCVTLPSISARGTCQPSRTHSSARLCQNKIEAVAPKAAR